MALRLVLDRTYQPRVWVHVRTASTQWIALIDERMAREFKAAAKICGYRAVVRVSRRKPSGIKPNTIYRVGV